MMSNILVFIIASSFPHGIHFKNGVECSVCHKKATTSAKSSDVLLPNTSVCKDCHESNMGYKGPVIGEVLISKFNHQKHVKTEGIGCENCHGKEVNPTLPQMALCMNCHNGAVASRNCYTCHQKGESRLKEYHPPRWKSLHGVEARARTEDCLVCHQQDQSLVEVSPTPACENCHSRENITLFKHPENFLFQHPQSFYSREEDCSVCHNGFNSCRSCHEERLIYPMDHNDVNWLVTSGGEGGKHGEEAEADPERCLVCHGGGSESICATCHGQGGEGGER